MNTTVQVCTNCSASLAMGLRLHFCPYCGTAQLEKKLLAGKTTQNYDPSNPQHKPWRDKSKLPKRNYTYNNSKKKQSWCPPMRQLRVRVIPPKVIPKPETDDTSLDPKKAINEAKSVMIEDDIIVMETPESLNNENSPREEAIKEAFTDFYTEATWPIAVYDAEEWLAVSGMTVNISLIEQTLGRTNHSYWLRIGIMFEENETETTAEEAAGTCSVEENEEGQEQCTAAATLPSTAIDNKVDLLSHLSSWNNQEQSTKHEDSSSDKDSSTGSRLHTLAVLSSDVGKLIVPVLEDWVDLCSVDPMEYYMARHMEKILKSIAQRIRTTNLNEINLRQIYTIYRRKRTKLTKLKDTTKILSGLSLETIEKHIDTSVTTTSSTVWNYNSNQIICELVSTPSEPMCSDRLLSRGIGSSFGVSFDDWLVECTHLLVLTRGITVRSYPSTIRLSVRYGDRLVDPKDFQQEHCSNTGNHSPLHPTISTSSTKAVYNNASPENTSLSEDIHQFVSEERYVDPRLIEQNRRIQRFQTSQHVTHIVLHIIPTAVALNSILPSAEFTYDLHSIKLLFLNQSILNINEILAEGNKKELRKFVKKLANLIRLEYTEEGVKYSIIGALSEPVFTSFPWPIDDVIHDCSSDEEDKEENEVQLEVEVVKIEEEEESNELLVDELKEDKGDNQEQQEEDDEGEVDLPPPPPPSTTTVSSGSDRGWICPIHTKSSQLSSACTTIEATTTASICQCIRRECTLKGSDLWIFASILHPEIPTPSYTIEKPSNSECIPISSQLNLSTYCHISTERVVHCSNSIILYAVDKLDEQLQCELAWSSVSINSLLLKARPSYNAELDINTTSTDNNSTSIIHNNSDSSGNTILNTSTISSNNNNNNHTKDNIEEIIYYPVSSIGDITIDLTKHQRLFQELFEYLLQSSVLDLFLSRKTRLMKLIIKE